MAWVNHSASSSRPCSKSASAKNTTVVDKWQLSFISIERAVIAAKLGLGRAGSPASMSIGPEEREVTAAWSFHPNCGSDARLSSVGFRGYCARH
jgi:hypothetical protein